MDPSAPLETTTSSPTPDPSNRLRTLYPEQGGVRGIFSSKVADYTASRPSYPPALFERLQDLGALPPPPATVADLGAGTGLLTHGLLERGYRVFAVEPNAAMRAAADEWLHTFPEYRSVDGSAEATTLEEGSIDLITAAQSFHWFEVAPARRECLRILKPAGQVALIWNDRVLTEPLHAALDNIFAQYDGAKRDAVTNNENRAQVPVFFGGAPVQQLDLPHEHRLDHAGFLSLAFSRSYMPARASEAGHRADQQIHEIFETFATNGHIDIPYRTVATVGRPIPA